MDTDRIKEYVETLRKLRATKPGQGGELIQQIIALEKIMTDEERRIALDMCNDGKPPGEPMQ
jgi:hypothetical protein